MGWVKGHYRGSGKSKTWVDGHYSKASKQTKPGSGGKMKRKK